MVLNGKKLEVRKVVKQSLLWGMIGPGVRRSGLDRSWKSRVKECGIHPTTVADGLEVC